LGGKTARLAVLLGAFCASVSAAPASDCASEAAVLSRELSELPRLEVASPLDRPPYCITLETIMAFAQRVKAHVGHCPNSEHAASAADWGKARAGYAKLFSRYRCRPTLSNSRVSRARGYLRGASGWPTVASEVVAVAGAVPGMM
jgi:hypothetical protein